MTVRENLLALLLLVTLFTGCQYGVCVMSATMKANSTIEPPPNKFQTEDAWECTKAHIGMVFGGIKNELERVVAWGG